MKKADFIKKIAEKTGFTQKDTKVVVGAIREIVIEALNNDDDIQVIDGVKLSRKYMAERQSRNPQTGEAITVPAKHAPKCEFANSFKELVR